jgi:Uma2 family endonuclease
MAAAFVSVGEYLRTSCSDGGLEYLDSGKWPTESGPLNEPPFLVVEVLSPEDPPGEMAKRIADYRACGVQYIWVVDSTTPSGEIYTAASSYTATDGVLRTECPAIEVPLVELFKQI